MVTTHKQMQSLKHDLVRREHATERIRRKYAEPGYAAEVRKRYRQTHPEALVKDHAGMAVLRAVRKGKLVRPDACSKCGAIGKVQAHHTSYKKEDWLKVVWLCRPCHNKEHHPNDPIVSRIQEKAKIVWTEGGMFKAVVGESPKPSMTLYSDSNSAGFRVGDVVTVDIWKTI